MLSFTSSSNQRLPATNWLAVLVGALVILAAYITVTEFRLAARGFKPTVVDTEALWVKERKRASTLGDQAVILVGASRVQLNFDLRVIQRQTGLQPVQLAIDGSSFVPVFLGLARDPSIRGTVIVGIQYHVVGHRDVIDASSRYQTAFENSTSRVKLSYLLVEQRLQEIITGFFSSYADGGRPLDAFLRRIINPKAVPQYLLTFSDRSRQADYSKVSMPDFYYARVIRNLGGFNQSQRIKTYEELDQRLQSHISHLKPVSNARFLTGLEELEQAVTAIHSRGGRVIFVAMPTSGLVREIDQKRFPRRFFWDQLVRNTSAETLHFQDIPAMAALTCPDGSHLDYRDQAKFTEEFLTALGMTNVE